MIRPYLKLGRIYFLKDGTGTGIIPANIVPPAITGTPAVNETLTCSTGTWSGSPAPTFTYQWYRGASPIALATNSTYLLVQADAGNTTNIKCIVTATNASGFTSADSNIIVRILDALANTYITGLTLTSADIDKYNTFFIGYRSGGYNNDRVHAYGGATLAASCKALIGNFTATPVNSPTWTRGLGFTHTGTSYIATGYIPSTHGVFFTVNNNNYTVMFKDLPTTADAMVGGAATTGTASGIQLYGNFTNAAYRNLTAANFAAFATRNIADTYMSTVRVNAGNYTAYLNASNVNVAQAVANPMTAIEIYEGGRNLNGTPQLLMPSGAKSVGSFNGDNAVNPPGLVALLNTLMSSF